MVKRLALIVVAVGLQKTMAQDNSTMRQLVLYTAAPLDHEVVERMDPIMLPGEVSAHAHVFFGANKIGPELSYDGKSLIPTAALHLIDNAESSTHLSYDNG